MCENEIKENKTLFEEFLEFDNFYYAYRKVNKTKNRNTNGGIEFNLNPVGNINRLINEIKFQNYIPTPYYKFYIYEPKERLIYAPAYRDKVV